jgi:predicted metalloprotease
MRWTPGSVSSNVEDRRGSGTGMKLGVGGTIVMLALSLLFGRNLLPEDMGGSQAGAPAKDSPEEQKKVQFASFVLDDTQNVWRSQLKGYRDAKMVLFTDSTRSGCGIGEAAMGPFYCPTDEKVYIDLGFFEALQRKLGAEGDFAQAYVIAHEIGHHVQHQLGLDDKMRQRARQNPSAENALSIAHELQADCFAGVWAHSTKNRGLLESGDIEEGLNAASAVGDDRIQKKSGGRVNPETWTHGSAAQRTEWFKRGLEGGNPEACDTSSTVSLR